MKLEKLGTGELLDYSTILENIITTNLEIQGEISRAVSGGFCTQDEITPIYSKSQAASQEADAIYSEIQKEIDLRAKKDLGMKFGVRRTQSIIKELDAFIARKNEQGKEAFRIQEEEAKRISTETLENGDGEMTQAPSMEIVKDDADSQE